MTTVIKKHYLTNFTQRSQPKNALQKVILATLGAQHRKLIAEAEALRLVEILSAQIADFHTTNPRCKAVNHCISESGGDMYLDVNAPCENSFCRLEFLGVELNE